MSLIIFLFYFSLFLVFYTYIGYGMLVYVLLLIKRKANKDSIHNHTNDVLPEVTLFIAAYNEEAIIKEKMDNCNQLNYPKDKLKILWVIDGSNDSSYELLKQYDNISVLYQPNREGKTAAINRGIKFVTTPITVFTDANTFINPDAILEIVSCFNDEKVGCVAGEKRISHNKDGNSTANNEGIYWKYESTLKKMDYELYSAIGAAGELYAIRTSLYEEMPNNILLDDFIVSMKIAMRGFKIAYCDKAYASESGSANINEEKKRKVRIAAGGVQSIIILKDLLNIFKYKLLSFQYISHRVLRWSITPIFLFLLLPINLYITLVNGGTLYSIALILQLLFYTCGIIGWYYSKKEIKNKYISIPHYFLFMNVNVIRGFLYLRRKNVNDGTWEKSIRA